MARAKTDEATVSKILEFYEGGMTYTKIGKELGMSKNTVRDIVQREKKKPKASVEILHAPRACARTTEDSGESVNPFQSVPIRSANPLDDLTRERMAGELLTLIDVSKKGYDETRTVKGLTIKDRIWAETVYLKQYTAAIKLGVEVTGMTREGLETVSADPAEDVMTALREFIEEEKDVDSE